MNRNEGSHWGYLLYQKHRRMAGSDLQARKTCMTLPEFFSPHLISRPVLRHGKTKQNTAATNLARSWNDPDHNMLTLLPSVIMSNWSSYDGRCTNIHKEINCHPFGVFPPVIEHRLQQSAPLPYSRYYLPQIKPHYYFQLSGFPSFALFFVLSFGIPCLFWKISLIARGVSGINLTCYLTTSHHPCGCC